MIDVVNTGGRVVLRGLQRCGAGWQAALVEHDYVTDFLITQQSVHRATSSVDANSLTDNYTRITPT